jgi:DNA (cytosine-5)-methyltransferase 1
MKVVSLFAGIGGFDLAADSVGWETAVTCEINPFGRKVLSHYWPQAYHHDDIHTLTGEIIHEKIKTRFPSNADDIVLCGGFPCQPYSNAGKRLGKADERHLWPEMLRIIRETQPLYVVGENVSGLISWNDGMVFEEVQADLEAEGYEVQPFVLPACAVNAPHRRDRVWFVAHRIDQEQRKQTIGRIRGKFRRSNKTNSVQSSAVGKVWFAADTKSGRNGRLRDESKAARTRKSNKPLGGVCGLLHAANANKTRLQGSQVNGGTGGVRKKPNKLTAGRILPTWENFPTQPPVRGRNDGISPELVGITFSKHRNESIKAYGNAIVPQVAIQIFRAIIETEERIRCNSTQILSKL